MTGVEISISNLKITKMLCNSIKLEHVHQYNVKYVYEEVVDIKSEVNDNYNRQIDNYNGNE